MSRLLSDYFTGVAVKSLSGTEVDPHVSNGHEIQGVTKFRKFLGDQDRVLEVTYVWLSDDEPPLSLPLTGKWYDSRRNTDRSAEFRFYYPAEAESVVHRARDKDTLFLCQPVSGPLLALFCKSGSTIEQQLLYVFELSLSDTGLLKQREILGARDRKIDFISRFILELIGVDVFETEDWLLERLLSTFGETFPVTTEFSEFARDNCDAVDGRDDPDGALISWMEFEERLFMTLEKHIVGKRLAEGFMSGDLPDVDAFVRFSLSVQNRRKSRAGYSLANHVEELLKLNNLDFKREATTEKRAGPDFLFPNERSYHDRSWPEAKLTMLGVKTTCKDRWRQVLAEADRIENKHLLTLEPGISRSQTDEMRRAKLQLVVPALLQSSYLREQQTELLSVKEFLLLVRRRQDAP